MQFETGVCACEKHTVVSPKEEANYECGVGQFPSSSSTDKNPPPIPPKAFKQIPPLPPKPTSRPLRQIKHRCIKCEPIINLENPNFSPIGRFSDVCAVCRRNGLHPHSTCDVDSIDKPQKHPIDPLPDHEGVNYKKCLECPQTPNSNSMKFQYSSHQKSETSRPGKISSDGNGNSCLFTFDKNISNAKITQPSICKRFTKRHICQGVLKHQEVNLCELGRDSSSTSDLPASNCSCSAKIWGPNGGNKLDSSYASNQGCFSSEYRGLNLISDHSAGRKISRYHQEQVDTNKTRCGSLQWISDTFQRIFHASKSFKSPKTNFPHPPDDSVVNVKTLPHLNEDRFCRRLKPLVHKRDREWKTDIFDQKFGGRFVQQKRSFSYNSSFIEGVRFSSYNQNGCESNATLNPRVDHHSLPPRSENSRSSIIKCRNSLFSPDTTKRHFERLDSISPSNSRLKQVHVSKTIGASQSRYQTPNHPNMCINHKRPESALAMICACSPYVSGHVNVSIYLHILAFFMNGSYSPSKRVFNIPRKKYVWFAVVYSLVFCSSHFTAENVFKCWCNFCEV